MTKLDAIILAAGKPKPDTPLYHESKGEPKAMIDIHGRPMIEWVIEGLQNAASIEDILVVGLPEAWQNLQTKRPVYHVPDQGSMAANGMFSLDWFRQNKPQTNVVVGCSADIPHIQGHMIDRFVQMCQPFDRLLYAVYATPEQIETRYPTAKRTYATFKNGQQIASGDVFLFQTALRETNHTLWEALTLARKKPWRVAQAVGLRPLLKYLTGRLSLAEAAETGGQILNGNRNSVKVMQTPFVEMVMDGDKPHQIELLRQTFPFTN